MTRAKPPWFEDLVMLRREHPDDLHTVLLNLMQPTGKWNVDGRSLDGWLRVADALISQEAQR
jgi:hypothetical protein